MTDINEKYVYESEVTKDVKDRKIVRSYDKAVVDEAFTINELEAKIARIVKNKTDTIASLDAEIAKFQEKIDEATVALTVVVK